MDEPAIIDFAIQEIERTLDLTRRLRSLIVLGDDAELHKESAKFLSEELRLTCDATLSALRLHPFARSKGRKLKGGSAAEVRAPDLRGSRSPVRREVTAAPFHDGRRWRKYGEKVIRGCSLTRGYYRCTFADEKGCRARKQVERCPDDPTLFVVRYKGDHTCSSSSATPASSAVRAAASNPTPSGSPPPHQHGTFLLRFDSAEAEMTNGFGNQLAVSSHMSTATGDDDLSTLAYVDRPQGGAGSSGDGGFADGDDQLLLLSPDEDIMGMLEFDFDGISEEFASASC